LSLLFLGRGNIRIGEFKRGKGIKSLSVSLYKREKFYKDYELYREIGEFKRGEAFKKCNREFERGEAPLLKISSPSLW
jgi:hypothetical protein